MVNHSNRMSIFNLQAKMIIPLVVLIGASPIFPQQTKMVAFNKGQLISLITSISKTGPEADQAKGQYFQKVFPIAAGSGFKQEGSFAISEFRAGDYKPFPVMSFFSWPSRQAYEKFEDHPDWPKYKKTRLTIWEELRVCQVEVNKDMTLVFTEGKTDYIAFLWLNKEHRDHFKKYRDRTKKAVKKFGGKTVFQLPSHYYHSFLEPSIAPPDIVLMTEWLGVEAIGAYTQSEAFKENVEYFESGVTKFDSFVTTFNFPDAR